MKLLQKYFKPKSLTWLSAMVPIVAGLFMAAEPLHGLTALTLTVSNVFGGATPAVLINSGLVVVGLRGAV